MELIMDDHDNIFSGSLCQDRIGKDLQDIKEIGLDHAILSFNRSLIGYNFDNIIDVSKRPSDFIM